MRLKKVTARVKSCDATRWMEFELSFNGPRLRGVRENSHMRGKVSGVLRRGGRSQFEVALHRMLFAMKGLVRTQV